jgi:hypothetical protein
MPLSSDDIAEIINLAHEYHHAVDSHDPQAWTDTWTAEGELRSPFGDLKGREALLKWISQTVLSLSGSRHCSVNEVVDGEGDRATMRSYYFVIKTDDGPPGILLSGGYDDELLRVDGRWQFLRRVHTVDASYWFGRKHPPT